MAPVLARIVERSFAFCGQWSWFSAGNQPILTLPGLKKEQSNPEPS